MKNKQIKVALYIRVSTSYQAKKGYSLEAQEKLLRTWAANKKYEIYELYADRGISGKTVRKRPEMRRMLDDAEEKKFDVIAFWALSRFARSVTDLYNMMEKCKNLGISLVSYTEPFDMETPMGRAMSGVAGVWSQLERELIAERVSFGLLEMAEQGKPTCYQVLGYDYDKNTKNLIINEDEAEHVKFIFEKYLVYKNLSQVAELCREKGYRGKKGRVPQPFSVQVTLTRAVYCGYNSFHGKLYKGSHRPIITVETYNKVQVLLRKQGRIAGRIRINELLNLPPTK